MNPKYYGYNSEEIHKIHLLEEPRTTLNNYKKISMYLPLGISCVWKCAQCFNYHYKDRKKEDLLEATTDQIIEEYTANPFVEALVISGLEPFDNFLEVVTFIKDFRQILNHDIVIYSGYEKKEVWEMLKELSLYENIYYKFGRYIPGREKIFNELLGITLASDNQYSYNMKWKSRF